MNRMLGKITASGQTTIPASVRKKLDLKPGDFVEFKLGKTGVTLSKACGLETGLLTHLEGVFSDWNSKADHEAFRDL